MRHAATTTATVPVVTLTAWDIAVTRTYEANRNGLVAYARRICGPAHAADIAQDAFIRVWSNPQTFDGTRGTLTGYLYLVTRGMSLDRLRASTSQLARDTRDIARGIATVDEPSARIISNERYELLRAALAVLRPAEREVIEATYYHHMTYREVAERLGIPVGTVKSRMRLALVRLRAELGRAEGFAA